MYQRRAIRDQDRSTSNGTVHARYNGCSINDSSLAFEGDPVYCPVCKTMGTTQCVMPYRPYTGWDGRQLNLDGDLCLCQCPVPPRLIGLNDAMVMNFEAYEIAQTPGCNGWLAYAGYPTDPIHDEQVKFSTTGPGLAGMPVFVAFEDGRSTYFYIENNGFLPRLETDNASSYTVYWGDEALEKIEARS